MSIRSAPAAPGSASKQQAIAAAAGIPRTRISVARRYAYLTPFVNETGCIGQAHSSSAQASDVLWAFAFVFLIFFAASLCSMARRTRDSDGLRWVIAAGAAVLAAGATVYFGFDFVLANAAGDLSPAAAQALNVLALKGFLPLGAGAVTFGVGAGLTIIRGSLLPNWVGWLAIVIGLLTAFAGILGLLLLVPWAGVTSIVIFRRTTKLAPQDGVATPTVTA